MTGELDQAVRAEIAEALAADITDRPQACGHTSSIMCCPIENLPTLAAWFDSIDKPVEETPDVEPAYNDRGFKHYAPIPSRYGGHIRVYESSLADSPHIWVMVTAPVDLNNPGGETHEAPAHLALENAIRLRDQLTHLIDNHYQLPPF
jgi:hypothetical protein